MKVLGDATALATNTTKFKTSTAVYIGNTDNANDYDVTVRNTDDDADTGSITVNCRFSRYPLRYWSRFKR